MESLHVWCVKQYTVALLVAGRRTIAEQFLRQVNCILISFTRCLFGIVINKSNSITCLRNNISMYSYIVNFYRWSFL